MGIVQRIKAGATRRTKKISDLVLRELKANTSPLKASLSLGLGVLVGFSPLYGLQTILLLLLAFALRLNRPLALLGGSATPLPLVPFWIAAGVFTGKLVAPIVFVNKLIAFGRGRHGFSVILHSAGALVSYVMHLLPAGVLLTINRQSDHLMLARVIQWAIGCCVFALVSALVTVGITYTLFKRLRAARQEKQP